MIKQIWTREYKATTTYTRGINANPLSEEELEKQRNAINFKDSEDNIERHLKELPLDVVGEPPISFQNFPDNPYLRINPSDNFWKKGANLSNPGYTKKLEISSLETPPKDLTILLSKQGFKKQG